MYNWMKEEKFLILVGGIITGVLGTKLSQTKKARELAVKGLANGMILKDSIMEEVSNIKEEAEDICADARACAQKECECSNEA